MSQDLDLEILLSNMENGDNAQDVTDPRDITAEELFGAIIIKDLPRKASVNYVPFLNQGAIGACTVFGSGGALFNTVKADADLQGIEYKQPFDPWVVWDRAKLRGASDAGGWTVQGALKLEKDMGFSKGYVNIGFNGGANQDVMKYWIANKRAITTGSTFGNWREIVRTGIYSERDTPAGHCWQITEYDDDKKIGDDVGGFYSPNSWGGTGQFWMSYKQVKRLFTQYIALGAADMEALKDLKNKRTAEYLQKSKDCWNKERPNDIASPFEIAVMVNRAKGLHKKEKRLYYATLFSDYILRGAGVMQIWNSLEGSREASDQEIAVMFTAAVTREKFTELKLTRLQVATVLGRDLI